MSSRSVPPSGATWNAYRPDIDGLRAVAVLSVVSFHAFPEWVPGGFVGVDLFFVISGYLISTIIMSGLSERNFSFMNFYFRRIRRIFPALLTVLTACLTIGWFVLFSDEYMQLGTHVFGGAGFISNFVLWRESNYFDNASSTKPLLHLWSLGVEEQFYLVWPFLLWLCWWRRADPGKLILAIIAGSFVLNLYQTHIDRVGAFYSPLPRFWELMIGSLVAYWTMQQEVFRRPPVVWANLASATGAAMIVVVIVSITQEAAFPGWWALIPTIGAAVLIAAGPQTWLNRVVLSSKWLVFVGVISFPLYLWHWPILSFSRIVAGRTPDAMFRAVAVIVAGGLAWSTYRLIERPLRVATGLALNAGILLALMGAVGLLGLQIHRLHGLDFRHVAVLQLKNGFEGGDEGIAVDGCGLTNAEKKMFAVCAHDPRNVERYALLGDSKAASIFGGLVRTSSEDGRWLFIGGNNGKGAPVPVLSDAAVYAPYQKLATIAIDAISRNPKIETVLLATATSNLFALHGDSSIDELPNTQYYTTALQGLDNAVTRLIGAGKKVVLLVDNPTLPDPHDCLVRKISSGRIAALLQAHPNPACGVTIGRHLALSENYRKLLQEIASRHPAKVAVFDTLKYMCDVREGLCLPYKDGRMLYSYTYHMSDYAAGLIGKDLNRYLDDLHPSITAGETQSSDSPLGPRP